MKVEHLEARLTIDIPISIVMPEGTLAKIQEQGQNDPKLVTHYRTMLKNQANMQLHELPKKVTITRSNVPVLEEIKKD